MSIEEILFQPIALNPHTRLYFKHHPTQEYFRQTYHYLGPFCRFLQPDLNSSTIFCEKLDFPTVHHNRYIKLHWAQFPMIGNMKSVIKSLKDFQNSLIQKCTCFTLLVTELNTTFQIHFMAKLP